MRGVQRSWQIMSSTPATTVCEAWRPQHAEGPAAMLAIGTANPANCVSQEEYTDYIFRVSKTEGLPGLKDSLRRICKKSGIKKRFFHMDEEMLDAHPNFHDRESPSLEARIDITSKQVPTLAATAAAKAIAEWGRPATDITHVIFSSFASAGGPGPEFHLASLLGLRASVSRTTLNLHGCAGAAKALHLAKDIAENNRGARVLVACSEITLIGYSRPTEGCFDSILAHGLFGDGAGAVIVGTGPVTGPERPLFEMVSATQTTIPMTEHEISMQFMESGMDYHIGKQVPALVERNIERCLVDAIGPLGIGAEWNDLFWAVHPGGRAILDAVEAVFALEPGKLAASRHVLSEYGNMTSATLLFVLDEMRRRLTASQDGEEADRWGVMVAFGPGITVEMMVLRAASSLKKKHSY